MTHIYLVTGGERSGKSRYAQQLAMSLTENPVYIATARVWDKDFENRILRHQADRDERWTTLEIDKYISKSSLSNRVVVIDCVTLWLNNFFTDTSFQVEDSLKQAQEEFEKMSILGGTHIYVTNELGMGMHARSEAERKFVELQGWMNQYIAKKADDVIFMVSGISLHIKGATKI